ncbi:MAG: tRNA 2-thiouridine(34) synthase MnmA [Bdellovibrionales bacterium]|nr:tRNA 2-thiouridine(34) synthase MnmA [Bdellovibrionales bacterium]
MIGNTLKANSSTTVVVGMSGGVDSSVTAALLREAGYRVIGLFMKNWEEKDASGVCQSKRDFDDVTAVCRRLDIPYYSVEFVQEYFDRVFRSFLREYEAGYTPNPDILCNREIKFDAFFEKAMDFGADRLATGHYARTEIRNGVPVLLKGLDPGKDQSYFLHAIAGERLRRVMFPIGELPKSEVRRLAAEYDLATKAKKDSTGICFIGERNFQPFLARYLKGATGPFLTLSGERVGTHPGAQFFTLGQRKGLGLGGEGEPWFVVAKDPRKNVVFVERGEHHPALFTDELVAEDLTWIGGRAPASLDADFVCRAKVRYRQSDQDCRLELEDDGFGGVRARVRFDRPQRSITPGQSVVFYSGDVCLGGGVIRGLGENFLARGYSAGDLRGIEAAARPV